MAADGKVFAVSHAGKVAVVKASRNWEVLAVNDLEEECAATPAIVPGRLLVRTQNALWALGR